MPQKQSFFARAGNNLLAMIDSTKLQFDPDEPQYKIDPLRFIPYIFVHGGCIAALWVGWSWTAVLVAFALYVLRMFAVTGFYHRYFSHKTFETSRAGQLLLAVWGNAAAQRGPIWWASQHRRHHAHSDEPEDPHSPHEHSLYWAHFGWLTVRRNLQTDWRMVPDLAKYPELRFLDRFDFLVPVLLMGGLYGLGAALAKWAPELGTNGPQLLVWGFFISTVFLFHATCTINSLSHWFGTKRFATKDESRNNVALALLTMGEGWHNNHHRYPGSARQGFYWWEIDITYYGLKFLQMIGLIWKLRPVPQHILALGRGEVAAEPIRTPEYAPGSTRAPA